MTRLPAGDFDYETHGRGYALQRRPDPRIAAMIHAALGPARTVLNIGAGAGSYEPLDRYVLAIEPSPVMRAQRPPHLTPAINAVAEALPLDDQSIDASMATITVHQWLDRQQGLRELRRVTRGPIVILAFDSAAMHHFWLADYVPELVDAERRRDPSVAEIVHLLGGGQAHPVPIPIDCTDGFTEAFYARPEKFLEDRVRRAQSVWGFIPAGVEARFVQSLADDLRSGEWDRRYGVHRTQPTFIGSLRLIISTAADRSS